ncbi:tetratricopeptide repeat protein [Scytonema sp. UIC 10036]|uniref:serine/threonine-protein kinase n=1 Tax=Scytonema sp. UIC 10036 TaxID=2304196 RepID=UPI0012DA0B4F|nr:serine/threonine-protein kinase [Scytonema sp. UIC 10036]MUG92415.1 tetratricopeptide repeat protein [Scytonema sp. UIC 10036]
MTEELLGGRYEIIKELARGGFGVTYLARDTLSSDPPCVVKKLNPQIADVEAAKRLFQREAHILNYLQQSQQIPKYLNYFEECHNYYIVQEYIQGKSLDKLMDRRWSREEVINCLYEILSILKHLHQINIIHRDIKPSNIMRRDVDQKFVLIDFGAVKQLYPTGSFRPSYNQQLPPHTMIGTPGYAPAEQLEGRPGLNSDIYGLGMTAIHLLTGIEPKNLRRDRQNDKVIFPEGIDSNDSLATILTQMVYISPERRYQSVVEVLDNLNAIALRQSRHSLNGNTPPIQFSTSPLAFFTQNNTRTRQGTSEFFLKLWYIPILLAVAGVIAVTLELINPFIRPFYYAYRGNQLLDMRQPEAALEHFENLIAMKPDSVEGWKGRGDVLLSLGRDSGALGSYDKALSLQPKNVKVLNNKGKVLYKLRRYKEALDMHEKALEIDSKDAESWSGKGLAYMGMQKYKEASDSFNQLRQIRPDDPKIWYEVGLATEQVQGPQVAREHYIEALASYNLLLKRKPQNLIAWTDQGTVLLKLNRPKDALASYQKALEIDPNFYEALLGMGNVLFSMGAEKREEALSAFERASKLRPQDYQVWYNRGIVLAQSFKDHQGALDSFNRVIDLRNDFSPAWQSKGLALLELQRYSDALDAFNRAKELEPKNPYIWANRGYVLEILMRTQEARESYDKAVELGFPREQLQKLK